MPAGCAAYGSGWPAACPWPRRCTGHAGCSRQPPLPESLHALASLGTNTALLPEALLLAGERYENEAQQRAHLMRTALYPFVLIALAVVSSVWPVYWTYVNVSLIDALMGY